MEGVGVVWAGGGCEQGRRGLGGTAKSAATGDKQMRSQWSAGRLDANVGGGGAMRLLRAKHR